MIAKLVSIYCKRSSKLSFNRSPILNCLSGRIEETDIDLCVFDFSAFLGSVNCGVDELGGVTGAGVSEDKDVAGVGVVEDIRQ